MNKNKMTLRIDNFENEIGKEEVKISEQRHVIIFVVVFVALIFIFQLDYLVRNSFNEVDRLPDEALNYDALASPTQNINEGNLNSKISTMSDIQRAFIAEPIVIDGDTFLSIQSMYGNFKVPIYTLRDYDIDKGLVPKNHIYYPKIKVNVVGALSTHGILMETQQRSGYQTYSNKVYIRGSQVIDVGFQKRLSVKDNIKYYDNAILIVDTLNTSTKDFVRVYDDETGSLLFSLNSNDFGFSKGFIDSLQYSAVGDHFIAFSSKYQGNVVDAFVCFNEDGSYEVESVWNYVEASEDVQKQMKEYELETSSDCITFVEYTEDNNLVYRVKYLDGTSAESELIIPLH